MGEKRRKFGSKWIHHAIDSPFRDRAECGQGNGHKVKRQRQRLAMKIAAGNDLTRARKDQGIIRGAVHFDLENLARVAQGVAHGAVNLRHAAQAVSVLHARAALMGFVDRAAAIQPGQVARGNDLPGMRPRRVQSFVEGASGAPQGIQRQSSRDVRRVGENFRIAQGKQSDGKHGLGAVHERKSLFGLQGQGFHAQRFQRYRRALPPPTEYHFTLAD